MYKQSYQRNHYSSKLNQLQIRNNINQSAYDHITAEPASIDTNQLQLNININQHAHQPIADQLTTTAITRNNQITSAAPASFDTNQLLTNYS